MKRKLTTATLFVLCAAGMADAQVYYSTLVGTVRDSSGSVVPGARVNVTAVLTSVETSATTNDTGDYRMSTLLPGVYRVSVAKDGFRAKTVVGIELFVGQTTRIDLALEVGDINQKVVVEGTPPLVQTDTADRGTVMQRRELEALPLTERNVTELTYLVPGAIKSSTYNEPVPDVNGLGAMRNQYYVDGGGATSMYEGQPVERVSVDTVQEFKVETARMTADRGLKAGSAISVATKQGTNESHGTGYE